MSKIDNFSQKAIPYGNYFPDSAKFYADASLFTSINIPENFTLLDTDTSEVISEFKRHSLEVPYKNHKIYIARVQKELKQGVISKILIYFPAKLSGNRYFFGINKALFLEVLNHLQSIGYLKFKNDNDIFKNIFVKDLDMKMDMKLDLKARLEIKEYNQQLQDRFNGTSENFHSFDSHKQGFGISTYDRAKATISKPFLKFYDKSTELKSKNYDFLKSLSPEIQEEVYNNFIYRYEFTLKNKSFFDKFGISNRLEDILEVRKYKWQQIGAYFLNSNFQTKVVKPKDTSGLTPTEKIFALLFSREIDRGTSVDEIRNMFISVHKTKKTRYRARLLFEKIYYFVSIGEAKQIREAYETIKKWDNYFGFGSTQKRAVI